VDIFDDDGDGASGAAKKPVKKLKPPSKVKKAVTKGITRVKKTKTAEVKQQEMWKPENRKQVSSDIRQKMLKAAQERFGVSRVFGSVKEMEKLIVGIPIPALSFEYLIARDVLPLRSMIMMAGTWSTLKSSLLYEMMRWFLLNDGLAAIVDTEQKFSVSLASSVMQDFVYDGTDESPTSYTYFRAHSSEEAQSMMTETMRNAVKVMKGTKEEPGPGLCVPVLVGLDSLAAANSQENIDAVQKEGHAKRQHPINALLNKHWTQAIRPYMSKYPMLLAIVNHMKTKQDAAGNVLDYTLGGSDTNFLEAIEIKNTIWNSRISAASFSGKGVRMTTTKNSFGPDKRTIRTRFLWWTEFHPVTGKQMDRHIWDWNWSIVDLIVGAEGVMKAGLKANDVLIKARNPAAPVECAANMPALGMGKDEYLPYQQVGQMIHDNPEVRNRVRAALGIQKGTVLDGPIAEAEDLHIGRKGKKGG
jgi:hypothetical protein